jgi:hypothetical protein
VTPTRHRTDTSFALIVTICFAVVCGVAVWHHEMWSDEAQAWLLARDATGLQDLLLRTQYERHPLLWHVLLYFLSRITIRPEAMQALHLAIAAGTVFLIARLAPFPKWARALLCFGYFPLYEYGVLARNYSIGALFLLGATALFSKRREHPWVFGAMLALAAHTSVPALIVAAAIGGTAALSAILSRDRRLELGPAIKSCTLAGAAILLAMVQMVPPADAEYTRGQEWTTHLDWRRVERVVGLSARSLLPISTSRPFWGHVWTDDVSRHVAPATAVLALTVAGVRLRHARAGLIAFALAHLGLFSFFYARTAGSIRHQGFLFLSLLIALWLARSSDGQGSAPRKQAAARASLIWRGAVLTVLIAQAGAGVTAVVEDRRLVFSGGLAAARLLEENGLSNGPIVGHPDLTMTPVIAYLGVPSMYFPRSGRTGSYTVWDRRRASSLNDDDVFRQAIEQARSHESRIGVVLDHSSAVAGTWGAREVGCVSGNIQGESYCVYSLGPR